MAEQRNEADAAFVRSDNALVEPDIASAVAFHLEAYLLVESAINKYR